MDDNFGEIRNTYKFNFHHQPSAPSPDRAIIVIELIKYFGIDFVINATPDELKNRFAEFVKPIEKSGRKNLPDVPLNSESLTGLRSITILDDSNNLTLYGVAALKEIAELMAKKLKTFYGV
jgi:hypothetical protein